MNTQSNLEHALLYCIEVNLPAHRVGQLDRILVLASPVNDINMFAWDLNRVLCFVESDIGIRMQLCRTCMGSQETTITFMLSKQFIRPCLTFLCREARVSSSPVSEHGAFVYYLNHVCGVSPPPAAPAPPPPVKDGPTPMPTPSPPADPRNVGSSGIPPIQQPPPPVPTSRLRQNRNRPDPPPPLSLNEDSGTGGSSSYFYFSPKSSDDLGFFAPSVPPRTIPRKGYDCSLPAVAQPYLNSSDWAWLPQSSMYFEGPYQISSRVIITDTGTVVHEPNVLGSKAAGNALPFGRQASLPPRRQQTRHRTLEFQTAHTIAFNDPVPPQIPAKSMRKSPSYPPAAPSCPPSTKRTTQLGTCPEGDDDEDDDYIVVPMMASSIGKKKKPPPPPPLSEDSSEPNGILGSEVITSSVEVAVAVDILHTTTYSQEEPTQRTSPLREHPSSQEQPRPSSQEPPRTPPHPPIRMQKRSVEGRSEDNGSTLVSDAHPPHLPTKVDMRGDDQAGLLDFERRLVATPPPPKPVPKPRSLSRTTALHTSVSVSIITEH